MGHDQTTGRRRAYSAVHENEMFAPTKFYLGDLYVPLMSLLSVSTLTTVPDNLLN